MQAMGDAHETPVSEPKLPGWVGMVWTVQLPPLETSTRGPEEEPEPTATHMLAVGQDTAVSWHMLLAEQDGMAGVLCSVHPVPSHRSATGCH